MHDRILIPVEEHEGTQRAIEYGIELAILNDATVHLLHVTDSLPDRGSFHEGTFGDEIDHEKVRERVLSRAGEVLDPYADQLKGTGVETVTRVVSGAPHKRILSYTDENDIDVVVMGTRGRTGIGRPLLGGVTERVVRLSDVPVITIPLKD